MGRDLLAELADQQAIRRLVDAYAYCADTRDADGQMALFTADTRFLVFMEGPSKAVTQEIHGRDALRPVFEHLKTYQATTHFNGQSTITFEENGVSGVSYCLAHHVSDHEGHRTLMVASIRYLDQFAKLDGRWLFSERKLIVDWIETRPLVTGT